MARSKPTRSPANFDPGLPYIRRNAVRAMKAIREDDFESAVAHAARGYLQSLAASDKHAMELFASVLVMSATNVSQRGLDTMRDEVRRGLRCGFCIQKRPDITNGTFACICKECAENIGKELQPVRRAGRVRLGKR